MSGLLRRAAGYRANQRELRLVSAESVDGFEELGGTPEERVAIIEQIDQAISENRIDIGPDAFRFDAKRRGIALPILVNLIAILLVAGGAFYMIRTFAARESSVAGEATALSSAEGLLLRALRVESDAQLSAKDDEIAGIEGQLAQISAERQQLESSITAQLSSQEEALRVEFESALAAEQARLQGGGLSEAEIDQLLVEWRDAEIITLRSSITEVGTLLEQSRSNSARLQELAGSFSEYVDFYGEQQDLADEIVLYQERFGLAEANEVLDTASSLELLETKLVILRVIGSESVQTQYPNLTERLEAFLDALVAEQHEKTTRETLVDVNDVLDLLLEDAISGRAIRDGQIPPVLAGTGSEVSRFFGSLERLAGPE